ncbi:MAG: ribonuclease PH [Bifidobacteriaceae bacterium]|nr:ribonuclease PH [Bifidobacteriaceae bacterium]
MRTDQRKPDELRPISITRNWQTAGESSVLVSFGQTKVLCTGTFEKDVPVWMKGSGKGWVTAEYEMLPRATSDRNKRESRKGNISGRTHEISRLIARSLRAAVDLEKLGERQIIVDCDVLQADGGTRCAAITGGWLALKDCLQWAADNNFLSSVNDVLINQVAAVSVGILHNTPILDLPYEEDSKAETDMNIVMTAKSEFVEIQGTAEGVTFNRAELDELLRLGETGCQELFSIQNSS